MAKTQAQGYIVPLKGDSSMARVLFKSLNDTKLRARKGAKGAVTEKRVRGPDGRLVKVLAIDAHSPTFSEDLSYVFKKNVARARRENKKLPGTPNRVPTRK
jgi:hypothetical protein